MSWFQVERLLTVYLGVINGGFALAVLVGGAIRFPPPTYAPLLAATGGQVWPYGVLFMVSSIGLLAQPYWARMIGAVFGIVAHSTFAGLFLVAVIQFPDAAATAWWAYLVFSSQSAACAGLMWCHRAHHRSLNRGT